MGCTTARFGKLLVLVLMVCLVGSCSKEAKKASHLERAEKYFSEEKYEEAIIEYKNVLQLDGGNALATRQMALAYYARGELGQAFPFLVKARDLEPDNLDVRIKLARLFLLGRKMTESRDEVNAVLEKDPKNFEGLLLLTDLAVAPEEIDESMQRLEEVHSDYQDKARYHMARGRLHIKRKEPAKAEAAFKEAVAREPGTADTWMTLGDFYVFQKEVPKAEKQFEKAAELAPGATTAQMKLADFYLFARKTDEAKALLNGAVQKDPAFLPALHRLAGIALAERNYDECQKIVESILEKNPADPEGKLLQGKMLMARDNAVEALKALEEVEKVRPGSAQVHYFMGLAQLRLGDAEKAREAFKDALAADANLAEARVRLAELDIRVGLNKQAADALIGVLDQNPKNMEGLLLLSETVTTPAEVTEAIRRLQAVKDDFKTSARFHMAMGKLLLKNGNPDGAETAFKEAVTREPDLAVAHLALAEFFLFKRDPAQAEYELKAAADLSAADSEPKMRLADFYVSSGKPEEGRRILHEALQKNGEYLPAMYRLARLAYDEQKYDEMTSFLDGIFKKNPEDPDGKLLSGFLHLSKNELSQAIQDFQDVIKVHPKAARAHYGLGLAYFRTGDVGQAHAGFKEAATLDPGLVDATMRSAELDMRTGAYDTAIGALQKLADGQISMPTVSLILGSSYLGKKDFVKAAEYLQKGVELNPSERRAPYLLGLALQGQGKTGQARQQFQAALTMAPDFLEPMAQLVTMDLSDKKPGDAVERLKRQMDAAPGAPGFPFLAGRVYLSQNDPKQAEAAFNKAIELDPKFTPAYLALSQVYAVSKEYDTALARLNEALQVNPGNVSALMLMGVIHQQKGDVPKARSAYEKIIAIEPKFVPAANNLAYIYSETGGDMDKALKLAQMAKEGAPEDPQIADTLGWILYKMGNYDWALGYLKESASKLADNAEVQYHLGMTQYKLGNAEEAKRALEAALTLGGDFQGAEEVRRALSEL